MVKQAAIPTGANDKVGRKPKTPLLPPRNPHPKKEALRTFRDPSMRDLFEPGEVATTGEPA